MNKLFKKDKKLAELLNFFFTFRTEFNSRSLQEKAIGGYVLDKSCNFRKQIGTIQYNNRRQGVGVFISPKFFLTVAQSLFTINTDAQIEKINPTSLKIAMSIIQEIDVNEVEPTEEIQLLDVLNYDIHPQYDFELYLNDIALLLVSYK